MSKPSLIHVSGIQCSQIRKHCRNASIFSVSSVAIGKARAAYAQSFALLQQATIEFTCHDHSIISCSHHVDIVVFIAHIPFVVNHTINAMPPERLQQQPSSGVRNYFLT